VFLKAEYFSKMRSKPYTFMYGKDFVTKAEMDSPKKNAARGIEDIIARTISKEFKKHIQQPTSISPVTSVQV